MTTQSLKAITSRVLWAKGPWTLAVLAICLLLGSASLQAQLLSGSISGTVQDPTGAVVNGATVTLLNQNTSDMRKTVSNDRGYFTFAGVIPGTYTVTIHANGFKGWKQADLTLNVGDERSIDGIQLSVGAASESVLVESASQELVPTDNAERAALLDSHDIERLTVQSREISELLKILPGVTSVANGTSNGLGFNFTVMGADGSADGVGLSTNGAPYRGGTAYLLDGANIIDPGCNCWSIASVNPDMTAEVKVQTSNFGADNADGPVIINVTSKSGGSSYHGEAYMYTRNGILNSNLWQNNHSGAKRTNDDYYYPGGNFGGPVRIPGLDFNKNNKLLFWAGYEYQYQNPGSSTILHSIIPSTDMMAGNFTKDNTTATNPFATNAVLCPNGFSSTPGTMCSDPTGGYDASGNVIVNAGQLTEDPGAKAIMSLFPNANVSPTTNMGYNYYLNTGGKQNVYIMRYRLDYNLNENNKFYAAFQQGKNVTPIPAHMWWNPGDDVPYPGGGLTNPTTSRVFTGDLLSVISPTLTNELVGAWGWVNTPVEPVNQTPSLLATTKYAYGTYFTGSKVTPGIYSYNNNGALNFPDMSMPDLFSGENGAYQTAKSSVAFSDHVTKVYKTHTFKAGAYTELEGAYQSNYGTAYNGVFGFGDSANSDALVGPGTALGGLASPTIGTINPTANLVMGIASSFAQSSATPLDNMAYRITSFYGMDDWKVSHRLMLNLGWRFDHVGRWYDRHGNGMAVWMPALYQADVASNTTWPFPGVRWHGVDPGIPNGGSPARIAFVSPRLGMAYDVFGTGKTVIRGGWGEYRWNDQFNDFAGALATATELQNYYSPSGNVRFSDVGALGALNKPTFGLPSGSVNVADPTDENVAGTDAYNLTLSQQLPWRTLLEVAYVGNSTKDLLMGGQSLGTGVGGSGFTNQNKISKGGVFNVDPVTGAAAPTDPENTGSYSLTDYYPYYKGYGQNSITMPTHNGNSNYNAFQVSWVKQTGRLSFNLNYTWSKSLGILGTTVDPFIVHGNYGVLSIDRPQVINTSYTYDLKKVYKTDMRAVDSIVNDWTISGTTTWQSGGNMQSNNNNQQNLGMTVFDTTDGKNLSGLSYYGTNAGYSIQPLTTCNVKGGFTASHQEVNPTCFAPPALGQVGPVQYPYLGLPAYFNSDLTLYKTFHVVGKQTLQVRGAMFNFLNHPLRAYTTTKQLAPTFTTSDKVNFVSTYNSGANLLSTSGLLPGTPDSKVGYRLSELSVKYNF
ncbi:MAG: carboxypeptidase-like regulatory domain-containing protein [Terracidiphilus sp.]|jgi:hypothetical protein